MQVSLFKISKRTILYLITSIVIAFFINACKSSEKQSNNNTYKDIPFLQEYHEAYPISAKAEENEVRSIAIDKVQNVWAATASGIFMKKANETNWISIQTGEDKGPAFSVEADTEGNVWMGTWNGIYRYKNALLEKIEGATAPISGICIEQQRL